MGVGSEGGLKKNTGWFLFTDLSSDKSQSTATNTATGCTYIARQHAYNNKVEKRKEEEKPQHLGFPRGPPPWY